VHGEVAVDPVRLQQVLSDVADLWLSLE
jgi:hypothetical protein